MAEGPGEGKNGAGLFVAAGHNGLRLVSRDGVKWEGQQLGREGETFQNVCFGGGRCVVAGRFGGSNLFVVTTNGQEWKSFTRDARYSRYVLGMCYGQEEFLALGGDPGAVGASKPFVLTARDGEAWSENREIGGNEVLRRAVRGRERFVAAGDRGRRATSANGRTWEDVPGTRAADTLIDLAYGNGVFVGVGLHGLRMTSPDGVTWNQRFTGEEGEHLNSILWDGARFVAVGLGATYFSPDGVAWERRPNRNAPLTACHGNGIFVGAAWKGRLLRSPDAVNWEPVHRAEHHVEAVGFGTLGEDKDKEERG